MTDIVRIDPLKTTERENRKGDEPEVGKWYWLTLKRRKEVERHLTCVTHVGSNYVKLVAPGETSWRIHFDGFWDKCEYEPNAAAHIEAKIKQHWDRTHALMGEVQALTARLGVTPRQQLGDGATETQALALRSGEPVDAYKKALVKAKEEELPALFKKIKEENEAAAVWMKAKLIPLKAQAEGMTGSVERVEDRIFSVELYAGLVEEVKMIHKGQPAAFDAPIHVFQRRHYMDEECLVGYEHGGMDYKRVEDFDRWLCKPKNRDRILPFPRCIVAFRVRRDRKERVVTPSNFIQVMYEEQYDRQTFLYMRNGDQMFRLMTEIDFDEKLFPDQDRRVLGEGKLWGKKFVNVEDVITDEEYQGKLEDAMSEKRTRYSYETEEDVEKRAQREIDRIKEEHVPYDKASVYYDDMRALIEKRAKEHNRLVLVLQGLLDRSPVFHPHPPYQLWTGAGFNTGIKLFFDDSRALAPGEKPDFEAYRAKLNAALCVGSVTVGQDDAWEIREAEKYNERHGSERMRYRPYGNPGPGDLAKVARYSAKNGACTYQWKRERQGGFSRRTTGTHIDTSFTTGEENVLNVDAYTPGDFHIFFDDPRTRREYLQWAPLLLEAEECHAGNRDMKPNPRKAPAREPVIRGERPVDLKPEKPAAPRPAAGEQYRNVKVMLRRDIKTKGGELFKKGEILLATGYYRRELTVQDLKDKSRYMRCVSIRDVDIVSK